MAPATAAELHGRGQRGARCCFQRRRQCPAADRRRSSLPLGTTAGPAAGQQTLACERARSGGPFRYRAADGPPRLHGRRDEGAVIAMGVAWAEPRVSSVTLGVSIGCLDSVSGLDAGAGCSRRAGTRTRRGRAAVPRSRGRRQDLVDVAHDRALGADDLDRGRRGVLGRARRAGVVDRRVAGLGRRGDRLGEVGGRVADLGAGGLRVVGARLGGCGPRRARCRRRARGSGRGCGGDGGDGTSW